MPSVRRGAPPGSFPGAAFLTLLSAAAVAAGGCSTTRPSAQPSVPTSILPLAATPSSTPVAAAATAPPPAPRPVEDDIRIDFPLKHPVVGGVRTQLGTFLAASDGGVFALSHAAPFHGSM